MRFGAEGLQSSRRSSVNSSETSTSLPDKTRVSAGQPTNAFCSQAHKLSLAAMKGQTIYHRSKQKRSSLGGVRVHVFQ
jgi:hypothetical protein